MAGAASAGLQYSLSGTLPTHPGPQSVGKLHQALVVHQREASWTAALVYNQPAARNVSTCSSTNTDRLVEQVTLDY